MTMFLTLIIHKSLARVCHVFWAILSNSMKYFTTQSLRHKENKQNA